jgi:predicted component of type VI protein secretion system
MLREKSPHADIIRQMAEPEYLRELRRQAEAIRRDRRNALRDLLNRNEAETLRREIREAGETPCR